jgi:ferrous iron transport protein A
LPRIPLPKSTKLCKNSNNSHLDFDLNKKKERGTQYVYKRLPARMAIQTVHFVRQNAITLLENFCMRTSSAIANERETMSVSLNALKVGQSAIIEQLSVPQELYLRLVAMGLSIGKRVELLRSAAFSGPLHVRVGMTDIALRRKEGDFIQLAADSITNCVPLL